MSLRTSEPTNYENCSRPKIKIREDTDRPNDASRDHRFEAGHSKPVRIGPTDGLACFQSFRDRLQDGQFDAKDDCYRSLDILTLKKQNVINLNHNLITLNNSLFINDPLNDSLQWCLEPAYQSGPKSLFDNELNNDLYANSPFDSKSATDAQQQQSSVESQTRFNFHSNQNYELLSRRLDANLAELDIETFSRLDFKATNLLNDINSKFTSSEEAMQGASEQLIDHCSVDDSLISEINERTNALRLEINGAQLKPVLNSSFTLNSKSDDPESTMYESASLGFKTELNNEDQLNNNELLSLEAVGISVDSLDNSCFEEKCAEILNRCRKADKNKYRFAFEQLDESTTESLINYLHTDIEADLQKRPELSEEQRRHTFERYLNRIKHNEVQLNKLFNDLNRRLQADSLMACDKSSDKLFRSEYSDRCADDGQSGSLRQKDRYPESSQCNSASKLTRSLQSDLNGHNLTGSTARSPNRLTRNLTGNLAVQLSNSKDYVPLFNLNNSFNSDSSSVSAPRSLIKQFLANKTNDSPTTSSQLSASLESNGGLHNAGDQASKTVEVQTDQTNRKNDSSETAAHLGNLYTAFRNATDTDRSAGNASAASANAINANLRIYRKTSPIREEDEHETTKEVKKYTSFQNVTAMCRNQQSKTDARRRLEDEEFASESVLPDERRGQSDCPRSISMNEIQGSKRRNLIKQYSLKSTANSQFVGESNSHSNAASNYSNVPNYSNAPSYSNPPNNYAPTSSSPSNYLNGRPSMSRTNRNSKECSISSGYLSSGGSNNTFDNKKHFQQRMKFVQHQQLPVCEDKQVQTSIYENPAKNADQPFGHQCNLPQQQPILINELPPKSCCNSNNSPIYVYYPNYSLPDLNFVHSSFQNRVHLSPTKYQVPPSLESSCSTVTNFKRRGSAGQKVPNLRAGCSTTTNTKTRPKSCGDFEKLTKESFRHIQDWESLKTLLPDDIKNLIKTLNLSDDEEADESGRTRSKTTSNTPITNKTFQMAIGNQTASSVSTASNPSSASYANKNPAIRMRPKVLSRGSSTDRPSDRPYAYGCPSGCPSNDCSSSSNNKRYSLQEPIHSDDCPLNCSAANTEVSSCGGGGQRRGMIKSATMNMPVIVQQQQRQMHRPFYQAPCHSCCGINQMNLLQQQQMLMMNQPMSSCCSSCHCSASNQFGNPFSNQFSNQFGNQFNSQQCHHLAGYPAYGGNHPPYSMADHTYQTYQTYGQFKAMSPCKPCNPISEQNEDADFESLNCLMEGGTTASGELDFDKLLNCKGNLSRAPPQRETGTRTGQIRSAGETKRNNGGFRSKLADCPRELRNSKENFNDLKNHWEKVAKKQTVTPAATAQRSNNVRRDGQSKAAVSAASSVTPHSSGQTANKRPASNRPSRNPIKSKVDSRRSRSKSPEKSNKEVIILTKKANAKPTLPSRQSNTLTRGKAAATDRPQSNSQANKPVASQTQTATKKPVRPSSFNVQFKSMIPVPKSSNRSPPLK